MTIFVCAMRDVWCARYARGERRQRGTTEADELFLATRARLFLISLRSNDIFAAAQENAQWRYKSYLRMLGTAW